MKVSVWDTYVKRADGKTMHFDILVPVSLKDQNEVFAFGEAYLKTKSFHTGELSAKECQFCHIEKAPSNVIQDIKKQGFHIIEMENCV